jgi:hypothetical protein
MGNTCSRSLAHQHIAVVRENIFICGILRFLRAKFPADGADFRR